MITAPDREWLSSFVRALVDDRLAACGHVDSMHTTYRWAGEVHEGTEARAVLHTVRANVPSVVQRTEREHPYEVASVVAVPIIGGRPDYLAWIRESST